MKSRFRYIVWFGRGLPASALYTLYNHERLRVRAMELEVQHHRSRIHNQRVEIKRLALKLAEVKASGQA